ncbi:hypothetical protein [Vibrio crassostreae]|uniref:hypothetical protein n=1 Tax=Vibrio crassostreae TaxID=246167 RepID=UPI001B304CF1|nr:hypothetical protein [Vibrio crassostreae]
MKFNYRLVERTYPCGGTELAIHSVYYDKEGNIISWSEEVSRMIAHDIEDMKLEIEQHAKALTRPVLKLVIDENQKEKLVEK